MIKAIRLIFEPAQAWTEIAQAKKSLRAVFFLFLLPLVILSVGGEVAGMHYWGRLDDLNEKVKLSTKILIYYGVAQFVLSLVVVFLGASLIKGLAGTFHGRHTYEQCFRLAAYAISPLYLVRLLDVHPRMDLWVCFAIGIVLSVATLYQGVPRMLEPDPPHAFGLYVSSMIILTIVAGLARALSWLVLIGKIAG